MDSPLAVEADKVGVHLVRPLATFIAKIRYFSPRKKMLHYHLQAGLYSPLKTLLNVTKMYFLKTYTYLNFHKSL